jgi:predicted RNA methylase
MGERPMGAAKEAADDMNRLFHTMAQKVLVLPRRLADRINGYRHQRYVQRVFSTQRLERLRREILDYYTALPADRVSPELAEATAFLRQHSATYFPCTLSKNYGAADVSLSLDPDRGLHYALVNGKRMYFKRGWTEDECIQYCYCIQQEQDENSPHRYLAGGFTVQGGDIVADIGAAEGIFALEVIEQAGKVYLFEADRGWIEALEATFAPWKEKVEIVDRFVSDTDTPATVTLDGFFRDRAHPNFLKVDVDGAETKQLRGCKTLLAAQTPMRIALCTYHQQEDEARFSKLLQDHGFAISYSKGYFLFINDELKPPYFRRGVLRATRTAAE